MQFDAIAAVETIYRLDRSGGVWLDAVVQALEPLFDRSRLGVAGFTYSCADACSFRADVPVVRGMPEHIHALFVEGLPLLNPEYLAQSLLSGSAVKRDARLSGWKRMPLVQSGALRAAGVLDLLTVRARHGDLGCWIGSFQADHRPLPLAQGHLLRRLTGHLQVAFRLQQVLGEMPLLERAAAVLDPGGRVLHAERDARKRQQRLRLGRAVAQQEQSRTRRSREDPQRALNAWESLAKGRWSLIDHFERDGRRYILAVENPAPACDLGVLTERERTVVRYAARGLHNKAIAWELGLAHSTVRVLLSRAACKLGVGSRAELLAVVGSAPEP